MGNDMTPPYTSSTPSPPYSSELSPGEQSVESTRRNSLSTGVYHRITDHLTIVIRDQHPGSVYPACGRNGLIRGDVALNLNTGDLASVILKLEGQLLLRASPAPVSTTFLSTTYVLWSASYAQRCPCTITFEVTFPAVFNDGRQMRALPPSFESSEPRVACSYSLSVELTRSWKFRSLLKGNDAVKIPLLYHPRSQPSQPILSSHLPFMSASPEDWHKVKCTIPMTQGSKLAPVECLLFIPSVQVYSLSDTIPFHLQIQGSPVSLAPLLEPEHEGAIGGAVIRVYLLRHTSVRIHGQTATASRNIGEGIMKPLETSSSIHHVFPRYPLAEGLKSLDWFGVLRCSEDVTIPGFFTSQISVKDSIALSVTPRQPLKSPLIGVKHSHLIRLVTDPWSSDVAL